METKAIFEVIVRDVLKTQFMQAADMFDTGKIVGEVKKFTATFKPGEQVTFERCQELVEAWGATPSENFHFVLVHLRQIQSEEQILLNTKLRCVPYVDYSVRQISDGQHTFFLRDYLADILKIPIEVDQFVFVKPLVVPVQG